MPATFATGMMFGDNLVMVFTENDYILTLAVDSAPATPSPTLKFGDTYAPSPVTPSPTKRPTFGVTNPNNPDVPDDDEGGFNTGLAVIIAVVALVVIIGGTTFYHKYYKKKGATQGSFGSSNTK